MVVSNRQASEDIAESIDILVEAVNQQVDQLTKLANLVESFQKTFEETTKASNDILSAKMDSVNKHLDAIKNEMATSIKPGLAHSRTELLRQHTLPDTNDAPFFQQKKAPNQTSEGCLHGLLIQWAKCNLTSLYISANKSRLCKSIRFTYIIMILERLKSAIHYYVCEVLNWLKSKPLVMKVFRSFVTMCDGLKDSKMSSSVGINPVVWEMMIGATVFYVLILMGSNQPSAAPSCTIQNLMGSNHIVYSGKYMYTISNFGQEGSIWRQFNRNTLSLVAIIGKFQQFETNDTALYKVEDRKGDFYIVRTNDPNDHGSLSVSEPNSREYVMTLFCYGAPPEPSPLAP